jgi:cytochrome b
VRIVQWSLATLVVFNLFNDSGAKTHRYAGYLAAAFVAVRLLYGVLTRSVPARLRVPRPSECWFHIKQLRKGRMERCAGHNPLATAMALLLWMLVALLGLTGWISRWDRFWGEAWPVDLHAVLSKVLQICVVLHLLGVALSSILERQNLARSMVTGKKYVDSPSESH